MENVCGLYLITNTLNNRYYGGSSIDIENRWRNHKKRALWGYSYPLYQALRKYGESNFKIRPLILCSKNDLELYEQKWLDAHIGDPLCYNVSHFVKAPMRGRRHTDETKNKISESKKLNYLNKEYRHQVGSAWRNQKQPAEMIEKRVKKIQGQKRSYNWRKKHSEWATKRYDTGGSPYPSMINEITGEVISSGQNIRRLAKTLKVNHSFLWRSIKEKRKSYKNWRILW